MKRSFKWRIPHQPRFCSSPQLLPTTSSMMIRSSIIIIPHDNINNNRNPIRTLFHSSQPHYSSHHHHHDNQQQQQQSSTNSSHTSGKDPSIKSKIMQIYKKTHPDLFENYPKDVRVTNQQSLQKLNNFLDEYKGYEGNVGSSSKHLHSVSGLNIGTNKYHLQFYIKKIQQMQQQQKQVDRSKTTTGTSDEESTATLTPEEMMERDLTLVKVTISGPPGECGIVEKSKTMSKNFSRLFRALSVFSPGEEAMVSEEPEFMDDDSLDDKAKELLSQTFAYMGKDQQFKAGTHSEYGAQNIAAFVLKQMHMQSKKQQKSNEASLSPDIHYFVSKQAEVEAHLLRNKIVEFLCLDDLRFETFTFSVKSRLETLHKLTDLLHNEYGVATESWGYKELTIERIRQKEFDDYNQKMNYMDPIQEENARRYYYKRRELNELKSNLDRMRDRQPPGFVRAMFVRGNRSFVSEMGYVMLGVDQPAAEWLHYLMHECNYNMLERFVIRKYRVLNLEKQVVKLMGITSIVSENDNVFNDARYEKLLQDICDHPTEWKQQYLNHLRIIITEIDESSGSVNEASIHPAFGFLNCPLCMADELYASVQKLGAEAAIKCQTYLHDRDAVMRLIHETKRYLKLEHLEYVRTLNSQEVIACCHKMIRSAALLKPILNNLQVCISDGFHWRESDNVLEIPVDF